MNTVSFSIVERWSFFIFWLASNLYFQTIYRVSQNYCPISFSYYNGSNNNYGTPCNIENCRFCFYRVYRVIRVFWLGHGKVKGKAKGRTGRERWKGKRERGKGMRGKWNENKGKKKGSILGKNFESSFVCMYVLFWEQMMHEISSGLVDPGSSAAALLQPFQVNQAVLSTGGPPGTGWSIYRLFQVQAVPGTGCSRYNLFQVQSVPGTICTRYNLFQVQAVPCTDCSGYWLFQVQATPGCSQVLAIPGTGWSRYNLFQVEAASGRVLCHKVESQQHMSDCVNFISNYWLGVYDMLNLLYVEL